MKTAWLLMATVSITFGLLREGYRTYQQQKEEKRRRKGQDADTKHFRIMTESVITYHF